MRKGILEMCVLAVIAEGETYPPEIMKKLEWTDLIVKEGTIYPLLVRLKNDGLVDYIWREGEKGPPRKYFTASELGRKFLAELTESWHQLVHSVNKTLENAAAPAAEPQGKRKGKKDPPKPLNLEPNPPDA
ncbi:MAG: PadR family transcriptional regulator [Saprospiraceae bacterium]|nr:PadR family transcriptional regulator [Saprospiraceae bacterium]MCB0543017.1 PadR family transcriptional regulator [Saprospiraceae bacterium]